MRVGRKNHGETWWAREIAEEMGNAHVEVVLPDRSRVDILTDSTAYEVDWAAKWQQGIGQALFYSILTSREPGLILLMDSGDEKYYLRALVVCSKVGITLEPVDVRTRS